MDAATLTPAAEAGTATPTVFLAGLTDAQISRLDLGAPFTVAAEPDEAALVVVSTRMPRTRLTAALGDIRARTSAPIIALAHTGGEALAVEVMRSGGSGVVAEGNEQAVMAHLHAQAQDTSLVETYDRRVGSGRAREHMGSDRDAATNLPGVVGLEARLEELAQNGDLPRVVFLRVLEFEQASRRLALEATAVLRRRLAMQYGELVRTSGGELFALGLSDYAVLTTGLSPAGTEQLGDQLIRITESFAPTGSHTLRLAVGHAGPEVASEVGTLKELAWRALGVASEQTVSTVVGADSLSLGLASTTELEALLRMLEAVEAVDPRTAGRGARIGLLTAELARHLGFDAQERARMRLAAHLHDVGLIGLSPKLIRAGDQVPEADRAPWRDHPSRGAALLRPSAGADVADAVLSHHEHWDGTGFPDGLAGDQIPFAARLLAIVDVFDTTLHEFDPTAPAAAGRALDAVEALAGTRLDPNLVESAKPLLRRLANL
jgi:HD-GYP domain-containing protein (c-di-GMP phosphodiesterase class II)